MTLPTLLAHVAARWAVTRTPTCGWVPDESENEMTEHQPHVGDIYASNDKRDIVIGNLQRWVVTTVQDLHVCFNGGSRRVSRRVLDTDVQRGYRLVQCAGSNQPVPERTYTRADMARAWREGAESEWHTNRHGETGDGYPGDPNPYEQEATA